MSIKKNHSLKITALALLIGLFVTPTGFSAEMTPSSMVFDNANYTA